ncbi:FecR family protein [Chitinophaga ginsengisegetis]|uniref:FecR family protein n=1 Tax=Chitinophaga ginsengisegetis TaxID=393003 RepID=A0A1T5NP30_9BACT|nr:FecR family protein [Chitinophaga ginsengisegetis]SKD02251.1 FecR family protein [Chitinophaga ginsengisegetis]
MNEQLNELIMIRYLQGTCSPEEKQLFESWLKASEQNRHLFYETRVLWYASRIEYFGSEEQLARALAILTENIRRKGGQHRKKIYLQWGRYAAILIVAMAVAWFFLGQHHFNKNTEAWLTASVKHTDSSKLVVLSDGTRIWLNSNSTISYPRQFLNGTRTVSLQGEAYFDVTHDSSHPFIIHTSNISIKVLGTSFNVQAYPGESQAEAVLIRGKIAIDDSVGNKLAVLAPGQIARFEKGDHKLTVQNVNTDAYTSWRHGQITLGAASLNTIVNKLSELYQVHFSIDPSVTDTIGYNFTFSKRKKVTEVMDMLCFVAPIRYQIQGNEILITRK